MADSSSMVVAVEVPMLPAWPHVILASVGQLGRLHGRMIGAAVTFPSAVILQEVLKVIY
jgi:hypothetical protein